MIGLVLRVSSFILLAVAGSGIWGQNEAAELPSRPRARKLGLEIGDLC